MSTEEQQQQADEEQPNKAPKKRGRPKKEASERGSGSNSVQEALEVSMTKFLCDVHDQIEDITDEMGTMQELIEHGSKAECQEHLRQFNVDKIVDAKLVNKMMRDTIQLIDQWNGIHHASYQRDWDAIKKFEIDMIRSHVGEFYEQLERLMQMFTQLRHASKVDQGC